MNILPDKQYHCERQIEVPLAKAYLLKQKALGAKRIAGIGDAECLYIDWILDQGFEFTIIDTFEWGDNQLYKKFLGHPNLKTIKASIDQYVITKNNFDATLLISTLEHLGRGGYNTPHLFQNPEVTCFKNIQTPFVFTSPAGSHYYYGNPPDANYSQDIIHKYLIEANKIIDSETYFVAPDWKEVKFNEIKDIKYGQFGPGAGAIIYCEVK